MSRLVDEAVTTGEPFIIYKAGKTMVTVTAHKPEKPAKRKLGTLTAQILIPDDFDTMYQDEIIRLSEGKSKVRDVLSDFSQGKEVRYLLDTHILIWILGRLDLIPSAMRDLMEDPASSIYFSIINIWEMLVKSNLPRETCMSILTMPAAKLWASASASHKSPHSTPSPSAFSPAIHRDPFDRLLIAQARAEGMQLLTVDTRIKRYLAL